LTPLRVVTFNYSFTAYTIRRFPNLSEGENG